MDKHVIDAGTKRVRVVPMTPQEVNAHNSYQAKLAAKAAQRAAAEAKRLQDAALRAAADVAALNYIASKPDAPQAIKDYAATLTLP